MLLVKNDFKYTGKKNSIYLDSTTKPVLSPEGTLGEFRSFSVYFHVKVQSEPSPGCFGPSASTC